MPTQSKPPVLLATDQSASVLHRLGTSTRRGVAYGPFGYHCSDDDQAISGFNGQLREPTLHGYLLGNGYRVFSPMLGRFISPDTSSPFGGGGLNTYTYCAADPVNNIDPTGHVKVPKWLTKMFKPFKFMKKKPADIELGKMRRTSTKSVESIVAADLMPDVSLENYAREKFNNLHSEISKAVKHHEKIIRVQKYSTVQELNLTGTLQKMARENQEKIENLTRAFNAHDDFLDALPTEATQFSQRANSGNLAPIARRSAAGRRNGITTDLNPNLARLRES